MTIVPIILAAGESSRMGSSKPLLDFDGRTCLDLALEACRGGGASKPIVVLGHEHTKVRSTLKLGRATVVVNLGYKAGQTSSLKSGLRVLGDDAAAFLLYPVDFPLITADIVKRVIDGYKATHRPIVIPSHSMRRGHPVLFAARVKDEFMALDDEAPARSVVNSDPGRIHYVDAPEECLIDMDTPEEYQRCLERIRKRT